MIAKEEQGMASSDVATPSRPASIIESARREADSKPPPPEPTVQAENDRELAAVADAKSAQKDVDEAMRASITEEQATAAPQLPQQPVSDETPLVSEQSVREQSSAPPLATKGVNDTTGAADEANVQNFAFPGEERAAMPDLSTSKSSPAVPQSSQSGDKDAPPQADLEAGGASAKEKESLRRRITSIIRNRSSVSSGQGRNMSASSSEASLPPATSAEVQRKNSVRSTQEAPAAQAAQSQAQTTTGPAEGSISAAQRSGDSVPDGRSQSKAPEKRISEYEERGPAPALSQPGAAGSSSSNNKKKRNRRRKKSAPQS